MWTAACAWKLGSTQFRSIGQIKGLLTNIEHSVHKPEGGAEIIQGHTLAFDLSFVRIGCLRKQKVDYLQQKVWGKCVERGRRPGGDDERRWLEVLVAVGGWDAAHGLRLFVDDDHS